MDMYTYYILLNVDDVTLEGGVKEFEGLLKKKLAACDAAGKVKVLETGTPGIKGTGISMVVYPGDVHYANVTVSDIDEIIHEHLTKGRVVSRLVVEPVAERLITSGLNPQDVKLQNRIVLSESGVIDPENITEYFASGGYEAIGSILENKRSAEDVIDVIKASGLRGRGGAGFPTGLKWEFTLKTEAQRKYILCNADEGEPGTFKDRLILEGNPHLVIEGMLIAGYAAGAEKGYIYIRGEYELSIRRMEKALSDAYAFHLLGKNLFDSSFSFDIEIKKGAGAYVCGEETALIESLEGRRGNPRLKPPFPGIHGLWGYPTIINNVETLANIAPIVLKGASWFRSFGTESCPGTKVFTILGDVRYTGVVELPMGITLREIIYGFGGGIRKNRSFKAVHLGGSAGAVFDESILDVPLDYDTVKEHGGMLGSGAVLVLSNTVNMRDYLENVLFFFKHESCGKCVPCRIGTARLHDMAQELTVSKDKNRILKAMDQLSESMFKASFCPLGQSLKFPVQSINRYFHDEI